MAEQDFDNCTIQDYAVMVEGLPTDPSICTKQDVVTETLAQLFRVNSVVCVLIRGPTISEADVGTFPFQSWVCAHATQAKEHVVIHQMAADLMGRSTAVMHGTMPALTRVHCGFAWARLSRTSLHAHCLCMRASCLLMMAGHLPV